MYNEFFVVFLLTKYSRYVYYSDSREGGAAAEMVLFINNKKEMAQCGQFFSAKEKKMDDEERTKRFFSLPSRSLGFILKEAFLKATRRSKAIRISYRLQDIKYDEESPVIMSDLNECHGIHIGDVVDIFKKPYGLQDGCLFWDEQPIPHPYTKANRQETEPCIVTGFIELEGRVVNSRVKIKTMFCTVAPMKNLFLWISEKMELSEGCILKTANSANPISDPLLLFWVEGLEKISNYRHVN